MSNDNNDSSREPGSRQMPRLARFLRSAGLFVLLFLIYWAGAGFPGVDVGGTGGSGTPGTTYYVPTATPVGPQLSSLPAVYLPKPLYALTLAGAPDGTVWFAGQRYVGHVARDGSVSTIYVRSGVFGMTTDARGTLWITGIETNEIDAVTLSGVSYAYVVPTHDCEPFGITLGPDGNLWFTERAAGKIWRVTPAGKFTEFPLPEQHAAPDSITVGPDGNLWFTEQAGPVGRITLSGSITLFLATAPQYLNLPPGESNGGNDALDSITSGSDRTLWFTYGNAPAIGRITLAGKVSTYYLAGPYSSASQMVTGGDSNVWFIDVGSQSLGQITPFGIVTEYALPQGHGDISALARGAGKTLWMSELDSGAVDRVDLTKLPQAS
jgi:virginiamycin B lyase